MAAPFIPPVIQDNSDGWGPRQIPQKFKDMPYQPFSKGDRLGKVSDWSGTTYTDRRYMNKYNSQYGGGNQYSYFHDEDESSFQLVDNSKIQKPPYQRNRMRYNQFRQRQQRQQQRDNANQLGQLPLTKLEKSRERDRQRLQRKMQKQYGQSRLRWGQRHYQNQQKRRDASVRVLEDWEVKEEMDFARLSKLKSHEIGEPTDLYFCGALEQYDKTYDRVSVKAERPLKRVNRIFHQVTTTDDPIIRKLAKAHGNVYATDSILATLMCCTRSQYSWDVVAQRVGRNKLFFDKRDNSQFDLVTVSETANEPPQEENGINSPNNLALEATFINHNFSQQVLKHGEKVDIGGPNPFVPERSAGNVASVAYRYRKWNLGNDIELVARTEHDANMVTPNGELCRINVKALNEWDSRNCNGVDWRRKLDSQRGAVLATELKNNSCKLAKWTMSALLAGSEYLKMGYVSRRNVRDTAHHAVIGTQQFIPTEFAAQINLSLPNAWGILRCIIDTCMKLPEGKYLILKDPNKPVVRIYSLPDGTFSSEEEEESDDESDDDESDGASKAAER